jgi:hypothetical protein
MAKEGVAMYIMQHSDLADDFCDLFVRRPQHFFAYLKSYWLLTVPYRSLEGPVVPRHSVIGTN